MLSPCTPNDDGTDAESAMELSAGPSVIVDGHPEVTAPHLSDETLEKYWATNLTGREEAALERHLLFCPPCSERSEEIRNAVKKAVRDIRTGLAKDNPESPRAFCAQ
jgi:hypothetical protein